MADPSGFTPAPFTAAAVLLASLPAAQAPLQLAALGEQKVSGTSGGFGGPLSANNRFGRNLCALGDVDGDGVTDLAVSPHQDDESGPNRGAVWILFLATDGTVVAEQKISDLYGNFGGVLDDGDAFGFSVAPLGDLDGDGVPDLLVGAPGDDDGAPDSGAVWVLFLQADGTVKGEKKLSSTDGITTLLSGGDRLGHSVAALDDIDGDGFVDVAVGANLSDDLGSDRGAVHLLSLLPDGTAVRCSRIAEAEGGFGETLEDSDEFGFAVACLGDLDGDGVVDLAVGARGDDDGSTDAGAVYLLLLASDASVRSTLKISAGDPALVLHLDEGDRFGSSLACLGDADGDGLTLELAVGAPLDDDGITPSPGDLGAVHILSLDAGGTLLRRSKLSALAGEVSGPLESDDRFGVSTALLGDLDGNGVPDLLAGASRDDDGGLNHGSYYVLFLERVPPQIVPYGCENAPPGTLVVRSGEPDIGTTTIFSIANPFGTQLAGSGTAMFVSFAPDPAFPCGTLLPGLGMAAPNTPGELLVSLGTADLITTYVGTPYGGPTQPGQVTLAIPPNQSLVGVDVFVQAYIFDSTQVTGQGVRFGLTDALQLTLED